MEYSIHIDAIRFVWSIIKLEGSQVTVFELHWFSVPEDCFCASDLDIFVYNVLNPLLHRLFLDHDIIFYFQTTLKKNQEKFK